MSAQDLFRPPMKSDVYRYAVGTNHITKAIPSGCQNRLVTMHCYLQDVFVLFGTGATASTLAVDRAAAPTVGTAAAGLGMKLEKDHPDGYKFFLSPRVTLMSFEASASAAVVMFAATVER